MEIKFVPARGNFTFSLLSFSPSLTFSPLLKELDRGRKIVLDFFPPPPLAFLRVSEICLKREERGRRDFKGEK